MKEMNIVTRICLFCLIVAGILYFISNIVGIKIISMIAIGFLVAAAIALIVRIFIKIFIEK